MTPIPETPAAGLLLPAQVDAIRARHGLISPHPWKRDPATGGEDCGVVYSAEGETVVQVFGNGWCTERQEEYGDADLDFVEAAPQDLADLLAHLAAREAQVAAVLAGLLVKEQDEHDCAFDEGFYAARYDHNRAIRAAAARLGLPLPETPAP